MNPAASEPGAPPPSRKTPTRVGPRSARPPGAAPRGASIRWAPHRALSAFVWGESREANDLVAYALAQELDPSPYWLEVLDAPRREPGAAPVRRGWIATDHLYLAHDPHELESPRLPHGGLAELVRPDEPSDRWEAVSGFLALPGLLQEIVSSAHPMPPPPVIVIANAERAPGIFRRAEGPSLRLLEALRESSVSAVLSFTGAPPVDRLGFDVVLRVDLPDAARWRSGEVTCERSYVRTAFDSGSTLPIAGVPFLAEVFARAARSDPERPR